MPILRFSDGSGGYCARPYSIKPLLHAFTVFPSTAAFEAYLIRAKETRRMFKESNWDTRDGESRVWRDIESHDVDPDTNPGY